ncbi:hypothetical protein EDC30_103200 [Paucimonas lemoignei]|uniref:IrrE N-terminal-like domain-containing protein n=1 Tax=Paucimonas lemoignei TaxID=29443 RepID=A0A4R3HXL5_PAULE|nr:hypothetical protein [Paucimonas lemoignei]TCS37908.1 hypothetical protein EDC30_103200 [Paucimonas lemoignei]
MPNNAQQFKVRLAQATGLSDSAINAAWPEWWSDAADASPSAQAELRFSIARNLGLDPRSLLDDQAPRFVWNEAAKYKNFTGDQERDRPAITSFGASVSRTLVRAVPQHYSLVGVPAFTIRQSILANKSFISFVDLLGLVWGMGIPTIHLKVYPLSAKRMCAMAVRIGERAAILLAKDSQYPASIAFHLAHEIGHIALGHIDEGSALIDMEDPAEQTENIDDEELAADRYALELLTGDPNFTIEKQGQGRNARQLANEALQTGPAHGIEPGTLALCYGHVTKEWATVQAAMAHIYTNAKPAWSETNKVAAREISWELLSDERASFLHAVMGGI